MLKVKILFICLFAFCLPLTSCSTKNINNSENQDVTKIQEEKLDIKPNESVYGVTAKTYVKNDLAALYAQIILREIQDNITGFNVCTKDDKGWDSNIVFIDVNRDDAPDLFVGTYGATGRGCYNVYMSDGTALGNIRCTSLLESGTFINDVLVLDIGQPGYVKISKNFPSVVISNWPVIEINGNNCDIKITDEFGNVEEIIGKTFDDFKKIVADFFNVEYDEFLKKTNYVCVNGSLIVPNSENYTEEDIYNCILELLNEYEELTAEQ